jgi:hypothetical protein
LEKADMVLGTHSASGWTSILNRRNGLGRRCPVKPIRKN